MPSCHQRRHFMYAFPVGAFHRAGFPGSFFFEEPAAAETSIWSNHKAFTDESDQSFITRMEVPGVKAKHVTIEEKDGEIEITAIRLDVNGELLKIYQEVLYFSPHKSDLSNVRATLTNGILTLTIPKNLAVKEDVEVETAETPIDLPENTFRFSLDLPGIAASNLSVKVRDDKVLLQGRRTCGNKPMLVHRVYDAPPTIDTSQTRALLQDGVFTFLAPVHEKDTNSSIRTIFVEEESFLEPSIAQINLADTEKNDRDKEKEMTTVETVDKDEWEKISDA